MTSSDRSVVPFSDFEQLRSAREVILHEAEALRTLAGQLDASFCLAVELIRECAGSVIVTGIGKAGLVGQKIAATLSSTGSRAHFLHATEAVHGDLGCLHSSDILLALSNSGETDEVCRLVPIVQRLGVRVIAVTAHHQSTLGRDADITVAIGKHAEAGAHGLAPSTSTTVMLAIGDALALVVSRLKGFSPRDFAVFHPGGSLGLKLSRVAEVMRRGADLRIGNCNATIRHVFSQLSRPGRRTGAVILVDDDGKLAGLFTDSDLARLLEQHREDQLDRPVQEVMTRNPLTTRPDVTVGDLLTTFSSRRVSEIPVVNDAGEPVGFLPEENRSASRSVA